MDLDEFRRILLNSNVDVWNFIDTAITVASLDYGDELKTRRDRIVENLYTQYRSRNSDTDDHMQNGGYRSNKVVAGTNREDSSPVQRNNIGSPSTPESIHSHDGDGEEEEERDPYASLFDDEEDEETKVVRIKDCLEDPDQSEDSLVMSLQSLADMDITFNALKVTDIGRYVNGLRKHPSNEVRRLVKQLVRKWKDLVDEWVKGNDNGSASNHLIAYGDSPPPQSTGPSKNIQNGHHQIPDFAFSPNRGNGSSSGSDKNGSPPEQPKARSISRREPPPKPVQSKPAYTAPPLNRQQKEKEKESNFDLEKLASARKRLQENYKEAKDAKKQRKIQVMDIHEIPKPKNAFFAKNRGGPQGGGGGRYR
ncbi:probable mediator of RNA polymerase II transcription subunit 26c [Impatiens glandulifera]|uniref:probable mediator of RNA polymerase II transcription subunit 26c n=1 Tax=Impatiens glandulifera TaxID=253017 RepID=UPI001FB05067|nr:probable mediator of RNA polymerase II transcription subunit 26c [Impatiens glandulifera]